VPRPLLGLDAFASPPPPMAAHCDGPGSDVGLGALAVLQGQELLLSAPSSPAGCEDVSDDEALDDEIAADPLPSRDGVDIGTVVSPTSVCRFASPPLVFQRARQAPLPRSQPGMARPRTLGEFFTAAKSRSNALLQTMAVQRRLVELNFQPRRSSRIAGQPSSLSAEMRAVRNVMRKLGLLEGDEAPSEAALEAYHKMYELPLTDDMIEAIAVLRVDTFVDQRLLPTTAGVVGWSPRGGLTLTWVARVLDGRSNVIRTKDYGGQCARPL
jgi:hypothetical protein